jgi:hypothetical protein
MTKPYESGCTQVCNQGRDCTCTQMVCQSAAPEAGNFRIIDLGPDDDDSQPLNHDEAMRLVRTLLVWLLAVPAAVAALALAVSYTTERWADVIWAYLAQLS